MRRQVIRRQGFTFIELVIAIAIGAMLSVMAVPAMIDFMQNSRLREGANSLLGEVLFAQSEAIKRNGTVTITLAAGNVQVVDNTGAAPVVLRTTELNPKLAADDFVVNFGSAGMPTPFGTAAASDVTYSGSTCSTEIRCPGLRIDAGGGVRICPNKLSCP